MSGRRTRARIQPLKPLKFAKQVTRARGIKKIILVTKRPPPIPVRVARRPRSTVIKVSRRNRPRILPELSRGGLQKKPRQIRGAEISERSARQIIGSESRIVVRNFRKEQATRTRRSPKESIAPDFNVLNIDDFGRGDDVDIRTRKGGVTQVSLSASNGKQRTKFNIPTRKEQARIRKLKKQRGTKRQAFRTTAQVTRKRQGVSARESAREFGSDFKIFRVTAVGDRARVTRRVIRTNRAGVRKRSGLPQSSTTLVRGVQRKPRTTRPSQPRTATRLRTRLSRLRKPLQASPRQRRSGSDFDVLNFFA